MPRPVATVPHEIEGHWQFTKHQLSPYWALGSLLFGGHGGDCADLELTIDGEPWTLDFYDADGGGIEPGGPAADVDAAAMNEYHINLRGPAREKLHYHIAPRWAGMRSTSGDQIQTPFDREHWPDQGVDVDWSASNVAPERILAILPDVCTAIAQAGEQYWDPHYFQAPFAGTIHTYERYVRVHREQSSRLVGTDGVFRRLFHLVADQEGSSIVYEANNDEVVGHRHRIKLRSDTIRAVFPGHRAGKQLKHYHPRTVQDDEHDPLYHPKVGVLFKKAWSNCGAWDWDERRSLRQELDEALLNALSWSDVTIYPDATTYVADDHFQGGQRERAAPSITRLDDPTPALEAKQDALLVRGLRELTDGDLDVLESALAQTDGGDPAHPEALAADSGRGISTVYRVLERLDEWLRNDHAAVSFRSQYLKEQLQGVLEQIEATIDTGQRIVGEVLDLDRQQLRDDASGFQRWLARYAGEVLEADRLDVDTAIEVRATLTEKRSLARRLGCAYVGDVIEYLDTVIAQAGLDDALGRVALRYETPDGDQHEIAAETSQWWAYYNEDLVLPETLEV